MIIIPDIHGRTFWKDAVLNNENEEIIFLGDYVDPYPIENISRETVIENFKEIIEFKKTHYNNVTLLVGNHDLGYISSLICSCRTDRINYDIIHNIFLENWTLFQIAKYMTIDGVNYTFSHSAILPMWASEPKVIYLINDNNSIPQIIDKLNDAWFDGEVPVITGLLRYIGFYRGGHSDCGSPVWADISEIPNNIQQNDGWNYFQVFGHSQQLIDPYITDKYACLDCRRAFKLIDEEFIPITPESTIYTDMY